VLDTPGLKDYAGFGGLVDDFGITFLSSVPSMWRMILRASPRPRSPLTRVHVGSAPLSLALWRDIEGWCGTSEVFNTYGMTETANWFSGGLRPDAGEGFVGTPWGGEVRVRRDSALHQTGRGEVAVRSPSRMLGLWTPGAQAETQDGFLMTGDIGELAGDGSLRLIGRTKNEINRGGLKILAEEIDMLLERHPQVEEACGFGLTDEIAGELVGAVVRLKNGASATERDLIAWCQARARPEAVPHRIGVVEDIAKTDRGKPARTEIRAAMERRWC
jgi:acyl-CoA synthetase (AMP-forming)/AMP-acid ligase II